MATTKIVAMIDVALCLVQHHVLDVVQQHDLQDAHGDAIEQEHAQAEDERRFCQVRAMDCRRLVVCLIGHELRSLARFPKDQQQRQGGNHSEDRAHEQDPVGMVRLKAPHDPKGNREGQQAAQDGEEHARGRQSRTFVVVVRQLRRERVVRHVDECGGRIKEGEGHGVVDAQGQGRRRVAGCHHKQAEGGREGQGAEKQEGPAATPAGARPVRDVADDRIVDVVPGAADEKGRAATAGATPTTSVRNKRQVDVEDRVGKAESQVARAVDPPVSEPSVWLLIRERSVV